MRWVGQEHDRGCGQAILAMLTGQTYQEVIDSYGLPREYGESWLTLDQYLVEHGFAVARKFVSYRGQDRTNWPQSFADIHYCQVRVYEGVPISHFVVWLKDGTVLDPLTPDPKKIIDYFAVENIAGIIPLNNN